MEWIVADSFLSDHGNVVTAIATVLLGILGVAVLDRVLVRRASRLASTVTGGRVSQETATRLRFARRALEATIMIVAIAIALSQFAALDRVAGAVLASGAIAAAVIGFAARQVLANAVAGLMLAINQPIRIGDLVTFEGETGFVEDIGLTYTWLRNGADARVIIPNERLVAGLLRNDSIRTGTVATEAALWLPADADEARALTVLEALGVRARVAEVAESGAIRVSVQGDPTAPEQRLAKEAQLRADALRALREAQVRGGDSPSG